MRHTHNKGNVLFLVLIAAVLLAALSMAVKNEQSNKDASLAISSPQDSIDLSSIEDNMLAIRKEILKKNMTGIPADKIYFAKNSDDQTPSNNQIFSSTFPYQYADTNLMNMKGRNIDGEWFYTMAFEIDGLMTSDDSGIRGNELIAFLPGVKKTVCDAYNKMVGLSTPAPKMAKNVYGRMNGSVNYSYTTADDITNATSIDLAGDIYGNASLKGRMKGCFQNNGSDDEYVIYYTLIQR